jgi:hypothetical protein
VKKLLVFVLFAGCASYAGAAPQSATDKPPLLPDPRPDFTGHLDVPKNCQTMLELDGSVLMTCDCENCGQPEARDGLDPLPWACVSRQGSIRCDYGEAEKNDSGARQKNRI